MRDMIYLDSNVFIFAALADDDRGNNAREILKQAIEGKTAATCSLTLDEVLWKLWKATDREQAIEKTEKLLQFSNLKIIPADEDLLRIALNKMREHKTLTPRDAIHLAAALKAGATTIVTDDKDFDKITELKRRKLDQ